MHPLERILQEAQEKPYANSFAGSHRCPDAGSSPGISVMKKYPGFLCWGILMRSTRLPQQKAFRWMVLMSLISLLIPARIGLFPPLPREEGIKG